MALTVSGHKCQHYSGSGQTRWRGSAQAPSARTPAGPRASAEWRAADLACTTAKF